MAHNVTDIYGSKPGPILCCDCGGILWRQLEPERDGMPRYECLWCGATIAVAIAPMRIIEQWISTATTTVPPPPGSASCATTE